MSKIREIQIRGTRDDTTEGIVGLTDNNHFKVALFDEDGNAVVVNASDNLQTVINELASGISDNAGSQLKTSLYSPTGTAAEVNANNNLQTILKELDSTISDNSNTQLKTSIYSPSGTAAEVTASNNQQVSIEELASALSSNGGTQQNVTLFDAGGIGAQVDNSSLSLQVIEYSHHEAHAGQRFNASFDVDGVTSLIVAFRVEDQVKNSHMVFKWAAENSATLILWESPTWTTSSGSTYIPRNVRRDSSTTSILQSDSTGSFVSNGVVQDPTGFSTGSAVNLFQESIWTAGAFLPNPSEGARGEWILDTNTTYAIQITAVSGGIWLFLDWYEHEDGS